MRWMKSGVRTDHVDENISSDESREQIIANAKQEATVIVTEAEKCLEGMNEEIADWEEEKKRIASTHVFEPKIVLNVGGHLFTTTAATLTRIPDTMLGAMFSGRHVLTQDQNGAYFIDRDGTHFREILNFLRGSTASTLPLLEQRLSAGALEELKVEADFYGVKDLMFARPPPPPFKPAAPIVIDVDSTVTQGANKLWYIQTPECGNSPQLLMMCDFCGDAWIPGNDAGVPYVTYKRFMNGRVASDEQPRPQEPEFWGGRCKDCEDAFKNRF